MKRKQKKKKKKWCHAFLHSSSYPWDGEQTRFSEELIISGSKRHIKQVLWALHRGCGTQPISTTVFMTLDSRLLLTGNIQIKHYQGLQGELAEIPTV